MGILENGGSMKISKDQWAKVIEINEAVKKLDPILKSRIVDLELYDLFGNDYLKVALQIKGAETGGENEPGSIPTGTQKSKDESKLTIKEFYEQKKPRSATEAVSVFGFYLERYQNKDEFSEEDIAKAYYDAKVRKPKVIGQSLRDAKNVKGYLVEGSKKGRFRLSNVGENLVLHDLPQKI
jgi:hypothetical protein